jgi:hypothetical protein
MPPIELTPIRLQLSKNLPHDWEEQRPFPGLRRLNLHQNPDETLHIRRLESGLERPCGRSGENLGHFSSLVGVVVIARKLTYGNSVAIPSDCQNQKYEAI